MPPLFSRVTLLAALSAPFVASRSVVPQGGLESTPVRRLTAEQAEILSHMSIVQIDDGLGGTRKAIQISGVNVRIVDGTGTTDGTPTGLGNLIV